MTALVYLGGGGALLFALLAVAGTKPVHALLSLILMLLSLALVFFALGAPFVAALQVVVYAGAIMVLFVFMMMMLNLGPKAEAEERHLLWGWIWPLPLALAAALFLTALYALEPLWNTSPAGGVVTPKQVGVSLYREYLIAVELASLLLVAALVAAFHLAPPAKEEREAQGPRGGSSGPQERDHAPGS
jgi:NADH-quinone oxidoreductase subunit J